MTTIRSFIAAPGAVFEVGKTYDKLQGVSSVKVVKVTQEPEGTRVHYRPLSWLESVFA